MWILDDIWLYFSLCLFLLVNSVMNLLIHWIMKKIGIGMTLEGTNWVAWSMIAQLLYNNFYMYM